jgi:mono/diheme cytochrome c family protein
MRTAAIVILLAACSTSEPKSSTTTAELTADEAWVQLALPVLTANCIACHGDNPSFGSINFLGGSTAFEIRDTLLASGIVDEGMSTSRLLTKGLHEGPHFDGAQLQSIVTWLELELGQ